jgi:S1-C subfamily serine protease
MIMAYIKGMKNKKKNLKLILYIAAFSALVGSAFCLRESLALTQKALPVKPVKAYSISQKALNASEVYAQNKQSVVMIEGLMEVKEKGVVRSQEIIASGIILSADGLILTNAHVIEPGFSYTVKLQSSSDRYPARVIRVSHELDLALVKIELDTKGMSVVLGDSSRLVMGQDVVAIGNPLGFESSVSKGIISGLERSVESDILRSGYIQSDVLIAPGSSGGALFTMQGECVGVSEILAGGISFFIPINKAITWAKGEVVPKPSSLPGKRPKFNLLNPRIDYPRLDLLWKRV